MGIANKCPKMLNTFWGYYIRGSSKYPKVLIILVMVKNNYKRFLSDVFGITWTNILKQFLFIRTSQNGFFGGKIQFIMKIP